MSHLIVFAMWATSDQVRQEASPRIASPAQEESWISMGSEDQADPPHPLLQAVVLRAASFLLQPPRWLMIHTPVQMCRFDHH